MEEALGTHDYFWPSSFIILQNYSDKTKVQRTTFLYFVLQTLITKCEKLKRGSFDAARMVHLMMLQNSNMTLLESYEILKQVFQYFLILNAKKFVFQWETWTYLYKLTFLYKSTYE